MQPTGTLTFLFTDIAGSTRQWEQDRAGMSTVLTEHDQLLRAVIEERGGHVFKTVGDAFCAAFPLASAAVDAACQAQSALAASLPDLRVRMALHSGQAEERDGDYFGPTLNRVARLLAVGHGGQVLVSEATTSLVRDALPPTTSLRDLGQHRLKDLTRPERVFQVTAAGLPVDFPALASLDARPNNLPIQLTTFVGREDEVEAVAGRLSAARLLTLTGVGGTGKTRLSLQAAATVLDDFPAGVWFVELASLADPNLVPATVAGVLGVREEAGRPILETLADYLKSRQLLLVLDNCEHVLSAAAQLADKLLHAAPGLVLLATSREPLGVPGEQVWPVPVLSLPALGESRPDVVTQSEAVRLFIDRATAIQPDFCVTAANAPAVAQICQQLDGMPLALELAAARVRALSAEQIAERLGDRFRLLTGGGRTVLPRQQTLRAAIDWSYDLLPEAERRVLERLSVFASPWRLEDAELVCAGNDVDGFDVLDALSNLVAKSLVVATARDGAIEYRLLETIRQYGLQKLAASGDETTTRDRHLAWVIGLLAELERQIKGPGQIDWLQRVERQDDDVRAALTWGLADPSRTIRLAALRQSLWRELGFRSKVREGLHWHVQVRQAMEAADMAAADPSAMAWILFGEACFQRYGGDFARAGETAERAKALFDQTGDGYGRAYVLMELDTGIALAGGDLTAAQSSCEEALSLQRRVGDPWDVAFAVNSLGEIARQRQDYDAAARFYEEALALQSGSGSGEVLLTAMWPLHNLGWVALHQDHFAEAVARFKRCLRLSRDAGLPAQLVGSVAGLAAVAGRTGAPGRAARLLGAAEALLDEAGLVLDLTDQLDWDATVDEIRAQLAAAEWDAAQAEGMAWTRDEAIAYALADDDPR